MIIKIADKARVNGVLVESLKKLKRLIARKAIPIVTPKEKSEEVFIFCCGIKLSWILDMNLL